VRVGRLSFSFSCRVRLLVGMSRATANRVLTTRPPRFIFFVYARLLCSIYIYCAAHRLYSLRIRLVNLVTGAIEWHTVAYIPVVCTLKKAAPNQRRRERRCGVLQRVIYLAFQAATEASSSGVFTDGGVAGKMRAFLRILLNLCDQPEEEAVLCLQAGTTAMPCSGCRVAAEDAVTPAALPAADRNVLVRLNGHLDSSANRRYGREGKRGLQLEAAHDIHSSAGAGSDGWSRYRSIPLVLNDWFRHFRRTFSLLSLIIVLQLPGHRLVLIPPIIVSGDWHWLLILLLLFSLSLSCMCVLRSCWTSV